VTAVLRASVGFLWRHPWQLGLAVLGITAGVAVIIAVDLANGSARVAFLESLGAVTGQATHQIVGGPNGVDETLYTELRTRHGYSDLAPVVEGDVVIDNARSERVLTLLGADLFAEQALRDYRFNLDGGEDRRFEDLFSRFLVEPGSIVVSEQTATELGLELGDSLNIVVRGRGRQASLVATFADNGALGAYLLADIATAQEWLEAPGRLSRIDVRLAGDEVETFTALLPDGIRLLDAGGRTRSTLEMTDAFMINLNAMSLLALLVGLFLIYNSASFTVLQRRPLIGTLRALGVTRSQILRVIIAEAAVLGAIGGVLGVLLGLWLGENLLFFVTQSINDLYFRVAVSDVRIGGLTLAKGLLAGVLAALVAATVPAVEAAGYPPRLAIARSTLEGRTGRALPRIAAAGIVLIALALLTLTTSETSLLAGLVAIFLLILGFALLIPWTVAGLAGLFAPLADRIGGVAARLAVTGIAASLSRTGVAIVALAVAVSATIGVSVMVDSFRGSVKSWLEQTLSADVYLGLPSGGIDPGLIEAVTELDAVDAYSTTRRALFFDGEGQTRLIVISMAPDGYRGTDILDADPADVWPRWELEDAVLISEPYAYRSGVRPGETVTLPTDAGPESFTVLATFQSYDINGSGVLMSRSVFDRHWTDPTVDSLGLYLDDASRSEEIVAAVEELGRRYDQDVFASSNVGVRELSLSIFDRTFIITDILYWLALGVAIVGILGAMLALQLERGRELGLLRSLGMTRAELSRNIGIQTGTIGMLAGLAAIPLGIAMAWVLIEVINRRAFGWQIAMDVSLSFVAGGVVLAILAALVGGAYPAWRAGRAEPALAMREE